MSRPIPTVSIVATMVVGAVGWGARRASGDGLANGRGRPPGHDQLCPCGTERLVPGGVGRQARTKTGTGMGRWVEKEAVETCVDAQAPQKSVHPQQRA